MTALRYVDRGDAVISKRELERLHQKARAHDQYLAASKAMGKLQSQAITGRKLTRPDDPNRLYWIGWLSCLADFNNLVLGTTEEEGRE